MKLAAWLLTGASSALAQQVCDTQTYPLSLPSSRFQDQGDGTVTDKATRLMWTRCSVGQRWSNGDCVGSATAETWDAARQSAQQANAEGRFFFKDWRVPQVSELATLTERQCQNPRTNLTIFPSTPAGVYWTASKRPGADTAGGAESFAIALDFGTGGVRNAYAEETFYVRLVRAAEP